MVLSGEPLRNENVEPLFPEVSEGYYVQFYYKAGKEYIYLYQNDKLIDCKIFNCGVITDWRTEIMRERDKEIKAWSEPIERIETMSEYASRMADLGM